MKQGVRKKFYFAIVAVLVSVLFAVPVLASAATGASTSAAHKADRQAGKQLRSSATGDLFISNTLSDAIGQRELEFTVSNKDGTVDLTANGITVVDKSAGNAFTPTDLAHGKFRLGHEGAVEILDLPLGYAYTVTETVPADLDMPQIHNTISGKVTQGSSALIWLSLVCDEGRLSFLNSKDGIPMLSGNITVENMFADPADNIPVMFEVMGENGPVDLTAKGIRITPKRNDGSYIQNDLKHGKFLLCHRGGAVIEGLETGAKFTVREIVPTGFDLPQIRYCLDPATRSEIFQLIADSCIIVTDIAKRPGVKFFNSKDELRANRFDIKVLNDFADATDDMPITFTVSDKNGPVNLTEKERYIFQFNTTGTFNPIDPAHGQFQLSNGAEAVIEGLLPEETYTVTESVPAGFDLPIIEHNHGKILVSDRWSIDGVKIHGNTEVSFHNSKNGKRSLTGSIEIENNFTDPSDDIPTEFTVSSINGPVDLTATGISVTATGSGGFVPTNLMHGRFSLSDGAIATIRGLPLPADYTVTESVPTGFDVPQITDDDDERVIISDRITAKLTAIKDCELYFYNSRDGVRELTDSVTVSKVFANPADEVPVIFVIEDENGPVNLAAKGITAVQSDGSGAFSIVDAVRGEFSLNHNAEASVINLPLGKTYTVTEKVPAGFKKPQINGKQSVAGSAVVDLDGIGSGREIIVRGKKKDLRVRPRLDFVNIKETTTEPPTPEPPNPPIPKPPKPPTPKPPTPKPPTPKPPTPKPPTPKPPIKTPPKKQDDPATHVDQPKTGDHMPVLLLTAVCLISLIALTVIIAVYVVRKRRRRTEA